MSRTREFMAVLLACLPLVGVASSGCGKEEPPVVWKTSKQLPPDFPSDLPVYPKAEVDAVVSGKGSVIIWKTSDPLRVVQEYYTKQMSDAGFHVTTYPGTPAGWMGEEGVTVIGTVWGRQIGFALGAQGGKTVITTIVKP